MKKIYLLFLLAAMFSLNLSGQHYKKDGTPDRRYKENKSYHAPSIKKPVKSKVYRSRDSKGKIRRSNSARHAFMKQSGYPHGRKGYVIDHIVPLKKGGCDCPSNMQWQTIQSAKDKDKWEVP